MFLCSFCLAAKKKQSFYPPIFANTYGDIVAGCVPPQPEHVAGYAQHRGQCGEPAEGVRPPRVLVAQVRDRRPLHDVKDEDALWYNHNNISNNKTTNYGKRVVFLARGNTYETDGGSGDGPAELPPLGRVVADHVLDAVVEPIHAERPRDRNALEEDEEQQTEAGHRVRIEDLENVHSALLGENIYFLFYEPRRKRRRRRRGMQIYLRNAREPDQVADGTNDCDKDLLATAQQLRPLIDDGRDEALHRAELRVQTDQQQHEEEQTRP